MSVSPGRSFDLAKEAWSRAWWWLAMPLSLYVGLVVAWHVPQAALATVGLDGDGPLFVVLFIAVLLAVTIGLTLLARSRPSQQSP